MSVPASLGRRVLGLSAILLGTTMLVWRDFATVWQPLPTEVAGPARSAIAVCTGILLACGGAALQRRTLMRFGAIVVGCIFAGFAALWVPRVITAPITLGTWLGLAEECAVALACASLAWRPHLGPGAWRVPAAHIRKAFAICVLVFGSAHLVYPVQTAALVPHWLPPGPLAWVYLTGIADLLAGASLLTGIRPRLAAQLLTVMFGTFGALVWAPALVGKWTDQITWAGNALNLALVGAAWVIADGLAADQAAGGPARKPETAGVGDGRPAAAA